MQKLYAVHDIISKALEGPIMTFRADAAAIRMFSDLLGDNKTQLAQHPADYELLYLGYVNDDGEKPFIIGSPGADSILTGAQWLAVQEKNTGA